MWWIALSPFPSGLASPLPTSPLPPESAALLQSLAWWALQFSPRVCLLEQSVLLELEASRRLFGGAAALLARLRAGAVDWAQEQQLAAQPDGSTPPLLHLASAPTALAALAFLKTQTKPFSHCPAPALQARLVGEVGGELDAFERPEVKEDEDEGQGDEHGFGQEAEAEKKVG